MNIGIARIGFLGWFFYFVSDAFRNKVIVRYPHSRKLSTLMSALLEELVSS